MYQSIFLGGKSGEKWIFTRKKVCKKSTVVTNWFKNSCIAPFKNFIPGFVSPKIFLQCFASEQQESKAKHCRNVLGYVLGQTKNR